MVLPGEVSVAVRAAIVESCGARGHLPRVRGNYQILHKSLNSNGSDVSVMLIVRQQSLIGDAMTMLYHCGDLMRQFILDRFWQ